MTESKPDKDKTMVHDTCKLSKFFKVKKSQELLHRLNVVYHAKCTCGESYIGETTRNLKTRLNEHNPSAKKCKNSEVSDHLQKHSDHHIDFKNPKILGSARNRTKPLILEILKIKKLNPGINVDQSSMPLFLFNN